MSIYKSPLSASKVYTLAEGIYGTLLAVSAVMRDHLDFLRSSLYPDQRRPGTESRENRRESECRTTKICRPLKAVEVRAMDNLIRRIRSINPTGFGKIFDRLRYRAVPRAQLNYRMVPPIKYVCQGRPSFKRSLGLQRRLALAGRRTLQTGNAAAFSV
jgi:hypothetical protein